MRHRKTETPKEVDLNIPVVNQMRVVEGDCYGIEWSATDTECTDCLVHLFCAAQFDKNGLEAKRKNAAIPGRPYIDENKFGSIPKDKLLDTIRKWKHEGKPMTFSELYSFVDGMANMADKETVKYWCKSLLLENNYKVEEDGKII